MLECQLKNGSGFVETAMIKIEEIDDNIINVIRPVNENSDDYKILASAIQKKGQRYPITVRLLTDLEKEAVTNNKIKYGIIDGHHRFHIAKNSGQTEILASIDDTESSKIHDMILAYQLNNTSIRMKTLERGKVIYQLIQLYKEKGITKSADEIGQEIFGLKTAMSYRCLQEYNRSLEQDPLNKSKKIKFDLNKLTMAINKLPKTAPDIQSDDVKQCIEQLKVVREIEGQLRFYKALLLERNDVKEMYEKQKKKSTDVNNSDQ